MRVRRVLVTWNTGMLGGLPLWPSAFIVLVSGLMFFTVLSGHRISLLIFLGYLIGGAFWFVATMLSSMVLVTEIGIVTNVNKTGRAIAWGQITDYFEVDVRKTAHCVFLYAEEGGKRMRLDLRIPQSRYARFRQIIRSKVDARMEFGFQQAYGKKALEG